jgi:L-rhamnose mutarotase
MMPDMQRVCFTLQVKPGRLDEYKLRHREVWPDMLDALRRTGWTNYSLFLRSDGLLIGYLETPDFDAARAGMDLSPVNARWQSEMRDFFIDPGARDPDKQMLSIEEVFHLD